jgi:hypothetical protein
MLHLNSVESHQLSEACLCVAMSTKMFNTTLVMRSSIFWDITPRSPLDVNGRLEGTWRVVTCYLLHAGSFFGLLFDN